MHKPYRTGQKSPLTLIDQVTLHPQVRDKNGSLPVYEGYLVFDETGILAMGGGNCPAEWTQRVTRTIKGRGYHLTPGLIDGHCHIGLDNMGLRWEGQDYNERGNPTTPGVRAIDGIFHDDLAFKIATAAGVTTTMTGPGSANVVGGQFALIHTAGNSVEEMTIQAPAALKCAFGENPKGCYGQHDKQPYTRMGSAYQFRKIFYEGKEYATHRNAGDDQYHFNLDLEPIADALEGKLVLKIHAHRADDILTAIRLCEEFGLRYTLDHCTEGYLVVDQLRRAAASTKAKLEGIFLGPLFTSQSKPELNRSHSERNVKTLLEAGLPVALMTDHPVVMIDQLAVTAARCARQGISPETLLYTLTAAPAQILGQTQRGSLAEGYAADLALFSGAPLAYDSRCLLTVIDGQVVWEAPEVSESVAQP